MSLTSRRSRHLTHDQRPHAASAISKSTGIPRMIRRFWWNQNASNRLSWHGWAGSPRTNAHELPSASPQPHSTSQQIALSFRQFPMSWSSK
jgi:hypothetical protein